MGILDERVAVITGAGKGIGRAIALHLASEGAQVVVTSRTQSDLDDVVDRARALRSDGVAVVADATDRAGARQPVEVALETYGRVDILVNNVGGRHGADSDPYTITDDLFAGLLVLNLQSAWWTTQAALPAMRDAGWGRIINIGSGSAKRAAGSLPYGSAKHGMIGLTVSLASKVATDGITVNCVCPGWTNTPHNEWTVVGKRWGIAPEEAKAQAESENVQKRVLEPEELGPMTALLASPAGGSITGQVISVDGGYKL